MSVESGTMKQMSSQTAADAVPRDEGIAPERLEEQDLRRELQQLYRTREETFFNGSPQALEKHTERMLALEAEFARRFPKETEPDPRRTREGAREQDAPVQQTGGGGIESKPPSATSGGSDAAPVGASTRPASDS